MRSTTSSGTARDNRDVIALLNNGYRTNNPILRCVGEGTKQTVVKFDPFCFRCYAEIGGL